MEGTGEGSPGADQDLWAVSGPSKGESLTLPQPQARGQGWCGLWVDACTRSGRHQPWRPMHEALRPNVCVWGAPQRGCAGLACFLEPEVSGPWVSCTEPGVAGGQVAEQPGGLGHQPGVQAGAGSQRPPRPGSAAQAHQGSVARVCTGYGPKGRAPRDVGCCGPAFGGLSGHRAERAPVLV